MKKYYLLLILSLTSICFTQTIVNSPIPNNCKQMLLVITDSTTSTNGKLVYLQREKDGSPWIQIIKSIPVVLGRDGLGWGRGLNSIDSSKLPLKTDGDGRSPAGVFELGAAFGYASTEEMKGLKISYIPITEMVEKQILKSGLKLIVHNGIPNGDGGISIGPNVIIGNKVFVFDREDHTFIIDQSRELDPGIHC